MSTENHCNTLMVVALTLHVLWHDPVVQQSVVLHRTLHHLHQQVVGCGAGRGTLAFGLLSVLQAGQQEQQVIRVPEELLTLPRKLKGRLVLQDAGGQTQETRQTVVLDRPVLLVQNLTTARGKTTTCSKLSSLTMFRKINDAFLLNYFLEA